MLLKKSVLINKINAQFKTVFAHKFEEMCIQTPMNIRLC